MPGGGWTDLSIPVSVEEVRETGDGERLIPAVISRGRESTI